MLEVSKYIQDLLYVHDCVILPGFGGFVANYKPARFDENYQVVFPPSKDLGFNRNLTQNDGLLINHLAECENLSYSEAEKAVLFFVEDIRVKIQRGEKLILTDIGSFVTDRRHNLQFEPAINFNYLVDSIGLEQFELPSTNQEQIPSIGVEARKAKSILSNKKIWIVSAVAACLAVVAVLPIGLKHSSLLNTASMGMFNSKEKAIVEHQVQLKAQISPPEELVRYEPKIKNTETTKIAKIKTNTFYLIAGSFTTIENAKILQHELKAKSYPAVIIRNKKLFSVAINQFNDRTSVDRFKRQVIAANPKSSYWVLKK